MSAPGFTRAFARLLHVNMAFHFGFSTFFLLPKFMAQELGAGPTQIGAVATAFGVTVILAVPLVGRLLDALGNRKLLIVGSALAGLSSFGFVWVERVGPALFALRCAQGFAVCMFISAGSIMSAEHAPAGRLGQALGLFAGSGMIMTAVAPFVAELVAERAGYAPNFLLASAAMALALLLARELDDQTQGSAPPGSMRRLLRRASSLRMVAVLSTAGLGFGAMFAFSLPFSLELGVQNVRGFFLAFTAGALFVRLGLGRLIDQVGYRRMATWSLWAYGLTISAMYLLTPNRLELLGAAFGLAHGLFIPAFTAFVVSGIAAHERAKLMTLFHGAFNLGGCLVFILGIAAEHYGYRAVFAVTGALVLAAPMLLVSWPEASTA